MNKRFLLIVSGACVSWLWSLSVQADPDQAWPDGALSPAVKVEMRHHGYQLGDLLTQKVRLNLPPGVTLDTHSLPLAGPVKPWLDLADLQYQPGKQGGELTLVWQVFATVEQAQPLTLPELPLIARHTSDVGKSKVVNLHIPATLFYYSPVLGTEARQTERLPSRPPLLYATSLWQWLTALGAAISAGLLLLALWVQDRLPGVPFRPGPLTRLHRQCSRTGALAMVHDNTECQTQAHQLYMALCESAGQRLYRHNVHTLFAQAHYLQAHHAPICAFLADYWQQRYGSGSDAASAHSDGSAWLASAAWLERLHRRAQRKLARSSPASVAVSGQS
ncbi:hypothetical protein [Methylophilus aquaticus]|uniref:MxaA protein n=1 Tax=Methylophilus aquaticus TaxID=1971610 RepID=A0ABT9JUQ3_9PROT|nr:hypothetical protein [Methylophilus aquaticus]MDP8568251.1 hypothetical protein [Methylophilus aquaticus]